jgi:hypothetical protein
MIQSIKEQIEEYRQQFYASGNPDILYKLECIIDIVRRLEIKKEISLLDSLNIKREAEGLKRTIKGLIEEKKNV